MQIVTDQACDLSAQQREGLEIHYVPMHLTLDGKTYSSGEDVTAEDILRSAGKDGRFPDHLAAISRGVRRPVPAGWRRKIPRSFPFISPLV